ncbi:MAG: hypothetical protein JSS02_30780 [Planctomycetes bacterium]|nr:hypothetical protein [Planctomycetota bacterium]
MSTERIKRRGPITLLCEQRRLRWTVLGGLIALVVASSVYIMLTEFRNLKGRSAQVVSGMTRAEVEACLGPPALFLESGRNDRGGVLVWVDQLWQVEVTLDASGVVSGCRCVYSHSALRRALGQVGPLP